MLQEKHISMQGIRLKENKHQERNVMKRHHHQVHQILYVLERKGKIWFDDQNYPFSPDSLVFIPRTPAIRLFLMKK